MRMWRKLRAKEEIMKATGSINSAEFPLVASANEYLFLEVLIDTRDQKAQTNTKLDTLNMWLEQIHKAIDRTRGI